MQRLFSSFADGWPGRGLLIQRLLIGATLLHNAFSSMVATPIAVSSAPHMIGGLCGIFLIFGLWTPVVGSLAAIVEFGLALTPSGDWHLAVVFAAVAATLAMIGPGAWSMDARLFGRKHIVRKASL